MNKQLLKTVCLLLIIIGFGGCSSDDNIGASEETLVKLILGNPQGTTINEVKEAVITLKELNSGRVQTIVLNGTKETQLPLLSGTYDISVTGTITYNLDGNTVEGKVSALVKGTIISGAEMTKIIELALRGSSGDFVIEEIFFAGTRTPAGQQYNDDKYIKITNNTEETLYLDGMLLVKSKFQTDLKEDYTPDIMGGFLAAEAILQFPGNGTTYPVAPGKSIIFAEYAINHKALNSNSADLSQANFEKFFESSSDVNNPAVPDLVNIYDQLVMHGQGVFAYALVRLPQGTSANKLNGEDPEYTYDFSYNMIIDGETVPIPDTAVKIPNAWVVDVVNLGIEETYLWNVTAPSLDMGYAYVTKLDGDAGRYGKSVRRKVIGQNTDGLDIFLDTNNSAVDFQNGVRASLLEQ